MGERRNGESGEMFRVVEFGLDSSSAQAAGPGSDLYRTVIAVGAVGLLSP